MAYDRATVEEEIQYELDDFEADSLTMIRQFLNDIGRLLWFKFPWSFREAVGYLDTDGAAQGFTVTTQITDFEKVATVGFKGSNETAYRVLTFMPYEQFLEQYKTATPAVANPSVWTFYANQIIFDTIPAALTDSVEVHYEKKFTAVSADADVPAIPEKYKHVLKAGVKWFFWDSDDDLRASTEKMKFQGQTYEDGVGGLIGEMIAEDSSTVTPPHHHNALGRPGTVFGRR